VYTNSIFHYQKRLFVANTTFSSFAGADMTAVALNSILYHLMRSPTLYKKATSEIDAAVENGTLFIPVKHAEAVKLPYLKACINEAMRLHSSVGITLPRTVLAGGATISGFSSPERYSVGINGAVVQYDKDVFGVDAENFKPERWIEGDVVHMEKAMLVFGAGTRTCLGKNVSATHVDLLIDSDFLSRSL
jgi:cytochrome P450